jgi:hypothetical protein
MLVEIFRRITLKTCKISVKISTINYKISHIFLIFINITVSGIVTVAGVTKISKCILCALIVTIASYLLH